MNCIVTIIAVASIAFASVMPVFAQGRFGSEAAQRAADREEREAIRRAEHPELYEKTAAKPAEAPAHGSSRPRKPAAPAQAVGALGSGPRAGPRALAFRLQRSAIFAKGRVLLHRHRAALQ